MKHWQQEFIHTCDFVIESIEQFFAEAFEAVDTAAEEFESATVPEWRDFWHEVVEEVFDFAIEIASESPASFEAIDPEEIPLRSWESSGRYPLSAVAAPAPSRQPACVGCRHYHGYTYGNNLLICAMHPYGWDGDRCPDWEGQPSSLADPSSPTPHD